MRLKITTFLFAGLSIVAFATHAQKLPKVQKTSVRAPENIKIDGELSEWNGQFHAYNRGNHLYYTVSNDDNNLYLVAHMDNGVGNTKIFKGGLTFTIIPPAKKANSLLITFPAITNKATIEADQLQMNQLIYKRLKSDTIANKTKIDSLISSSNNLISKVYNQILVTGIPETNEPLMSINNTQGIRVAGLFDRDMNYTYELAIPIKYLDATLNNGENFKYNIKLNTHGVVKIKNFQSFDPPLIPVTAQSNPDDLFLNYTTDFSGEYTLAKKQ
jgi:hypothetical protein